jgi:3-deoxy-D-manno-octulosonic-acid transferase
VLAEQLPPGAVHQYAPVDTPAAVLRFLAHWRPDLAVFAESELWPNLILEARAGGVPMALLSARMSRASQRGWRRFPRAAQAVLGAFDLVLARDQEAAARLGELGAKVDGVVDLKTGAGPLPADAAELARFEAALAGRAVVLAASTHPKEDEVALEAFGQLLADAPDALLILAPRHVERGAEIERSARGRGLRTARRGADELDRRLQCLVADTLSELGLWYRLADAALIGGSLVDGVGGHNPFEPARLGCPVAHGPKTEQWPVYGELDARGAARRVASAAELAAVFHEVAADPDALAATAERARAYVIARDAENTGLPARLLELVKP